MRFFILVLVVALVGCGKRNSYQKAFNRYYDSCNTYFDKWNYYNKCKKYDSADLAANSHHIFYDSLKKYYVLLYPNGNSADKKKPEDNCNCK